MNSSEIKLALKKLNVLGSVLYIAAHPDDENTAVLSYFSSGKLFRTGYLSLTRGDGGQNLIGSEQGDLLGLIRTNELHGARKIDGAEQFFTRAIDFEGLIYASDHGVQVVNMSFGSYGYSEMLNDAIQYAHQRNVVLVAGAGNDNTDVPAYPAAYSNVLAVTATGPQDEKWPAANFGSHVALAAPGVGILTTAVNGGYIYGTGTSHAAAMVSGVAALLKAKDTRYTNVQIDKLLQTSADDLGAKGRDSTFGAGRANTYRALTSSP